MKVVVPVPSMPAAVRSPIDVVRRRWSGDYEIDEWGYDRDLVDLLDPIFGVVWDIKVSGHEHLPAQGPALLVSNRRAGLIEPFAIARGIRRATGRRVRFVGIPDVPVVGASLRRVGGAVHRPAEIAALLRADQLVTLPLGRRWRRKREAGSLTPDVLEPAVALGVPVLPVALAGGEVSGRWRMLVGEAVPAPAAPGPLGLAELAEGVHDGVQALLDEAFPPRWPWS
jgi:1-acyl-sn-glycerol-3-phosphate acyltransferase